MIYYRKWQKLFRDLNHCLHDETKSEEKIIKDEYDWQVIHVTKPMKNKINDAYGKHR